MTLVIKAFLINYFINLMNIFNIGIRLFTNTVHMFIIYFNAVRPRILVGKHISTLI